MGLTVTLSNALSGMKSTQDGLTVLSRNVANAGSSSYHRQDVVIKDMSGGSSTYSSFVGVQRAFSESLERAYVREVSGTSYANVRNTFLQRLETALGKPGDANSLDTILQDFSNSLQALAVSPEDYATRATVVSSATTLAQSLNGMSSTIQELRQETETQMIAEVDTLNQSLQSLQQINQRLADYTLDESARLSVLDERDRLITQVSSIVDCNVTYRSDNTVALMTTSGLGLLDQGATVFSFEPAGSLSANSLYNIDDTENGVGTLTAITPSGLTLDVFDHKIMQSGSLAALVELRDTTLVQAQAQLDVIAASVSQALSTNTSSVEVSGPPDGFDMDMSGIQPGNDMTFSYAQGGKTYNVRVIDVRDASKLPMNYTDASGERVIGLDFSAGAASIASQLNTQFGPALSVSNPSGDTIRITDGTGGAMKSAELHKTSTGLQDGSLGLNLFTDLGNTAFTNSLDGEPQLRGYASRISVNSNLINDNTYLVQFSASASLGDASRVEQMLDGLENMIFTPDKQQLPELGSYGLSGNVQSLVSQVINFQGNRISTAKAALDTQQIALDAVDSRREDSYGVNIDEEMARLMELQNTYAASARVVSVAQELIDALMQI